MYVIIDIARKNNITFVVYWANDARGARIRLKATGKN